MERMLVMRGGALGDFVLGLPALRALREAFPRTNLEMIAPGAVLPLAAPWVDVATPMERGEVAHLFQEEQVPASLVDRYSDLDLVVLWLADGNGSVRRNFERLGARRILWAPALPQAPGVHAADHLLATLRPLGTPVEAPYSPMVPGEPARERAMDLWRLLSLGAGVPVVAVHPGSGGAWKCWRAERFAGVVDRLMASGSSVVLLQGPADDAVVGKVLSAVRGARPPVAANLAVDELAAFLSLCSVYLGNDSGVTHLAAAVGVPTVALFGPTDPAVWGPRGRRVMVLALEGDCAHCGRERAVVCAHRSCLDGIEVERVVSTLGEALLGGCDRP